MNSGLKVHIHINLYYSTPASSWHLHSIVALILGVGRAGLGFTGEGSLEAAVIPSGNEAFHQQCLVSYKKLAGLLGGCPVSPELGQDVSSSRESVVHR